MVLRTLLALAICSIVVAQEPGDSLDAASLDIEGRLTALETHAAESAASPRGTAPRFYGDVQFMFLRADAGRVLDEQYKLAPRAVLGFEEGAGIRVRYWQYDYLVPSAHPNNFLYGTDNNFQAQRFDFQALDVELTGKYQGSHTDAHISGGMRWGGVDIGFARKYPKYRNYYYNNYYYLVDVDDDIGPIEYAYDTREISINLIGPTFAVDGRTQLWGGLSGVYGGRMSVLGGEWSDSPLWYDELGRDTLLVPEVYTGLELNYGPIVARVVYEYQQWRSDVLEKYNSTVSFDGVGCHLGFSY